MPGKLKLIFHSSICIEFLCSCYIIVIWEDIFRQSSVHFSIEANICRASVRKNRRKIVCIRRERDTQDGMAPRAHHTFTFPTQTRILLCAIQFRKSLSLSSFHTVSLILDAKFSMSSLSSFAQLAPALFCYCAALQDVRLTQDVHFVKLFTRSDTCA